MAQNTYTVTAPNGKSLSITGDKPPTEQELDDIFTAANVQADSKTPPNRLNTADEAARLIRPRTPDELKQSTESYRTGLVDPKDRNIFNQDVSTSIAEGVGGLYSGASNLLAGGYHALADPLKKGYEEGGATGTLGALLKTPYELVASATDARRALLEKAKTAESLSEKIGYNITGRIPFLGPAIAVAAEQIGSGRPETMGEGVFNALTTLQSSPSFRAMSAAGKAKAIATVKSAASKIPAPAIAKTTLRSMVEDPGLALTGAVVGYQEGGKLGAVTGALGIPSVVNKGVRMYREGLASKERMQERRITAKREDVASKLTSDATLLAEERAETATLLAEAREETAKNLSAKQQGDLFKLDQAHTNRLERDVLQAGTKFEQDALKRSQKVGDALESREHAALLAKDKAASKALESELQDELRTSRDGKTEQNRQEAFDRADAIRAQQAKLASEKETRTRNNALSDAARRNDRKAEITAAHTAAQLSKTHLSNVESILKAQTPDALNTAKQMADYHLELAENIDPDFRAALQGKIDQVFETQSATMAERLAEQNALIQGLESKGVRATRSSSAQDASGNRQRVTEAFSEPAPAEEPMPQQDAPASRPAAEPKGSAPKTKPSDKVTPDNVLEKLRDQAEVEQPSWERNQLRDVGSDAQQLSRDLVVTPEGAQTLDNMLKRLGLSARESGLINAATGSEVNMGKRPTGERAYDANRVEGRRGR